MEVLAAPDKMRGTLSAPAFARAIAHGATAADAHCTMAPLSDGGEGFSEVLGGERHELEVEGPLGRPVRAGFFLRGTTAVIEMAEAAGRALLPHPQDDEPVLASTRGVGQLIVAARAEGAARIVVGCGGSATTDGGLGCVEVVRAAGGLGDVELIGATDVTTRFVEAAERFGPQKGASPAQVTLLAERLELLAETWSAECGIELGALPRSGAAGGLGGGLVVLGGRLESGFDLVAAELGLDGLLARADLVVTGEGRLDSTTLEGKTVASIVDRLPGGLDVLVIAGSVEASAVAELAERCAATVEVVDLTAAHGHYLAITATAELVAEVVRAAVTARR
jgi:glycerate 2-kinase